MHGLVLRRLLVIVFLAGCSAAEFPSAAPPNPTTDSVFPRAVVEELLQMGRQDQQVRAGITPAVLQDTAFTGRMLRTDSAHTRRLQELVIRHGWPTPRRAGLEAAKAAFLIAQHSPSLSFQKQVLPYLEAAVERGEAPADEVALLTDRILVDEGLPQRYGTQFRMVEGKMVMYAVEDESGLDERRARMGLPRLEQYMQKMSKYYQVPVVRHP